MKYSVRGAINTEDGAPVVAVINKYALWRLITEQNVEEFTFEAWVNVDADRAALFNELKPFVDAWAGVIEWHECTHDEAVSIPCVIAEEYRRG